MTTELLDTHCAGHGVSDVGRRPVRADFQAGWLLARPSVGEHQLAGAALLGIEARGTREQANLRRKAPIAVVALNPTPREHYNPLNGQSISNGSPPFFIKGRKIWI